jgi:L-fuculose-phosphate aldolase
MMFQKARETVIKTCITLADRGYLAGTGGNIALRANQDHFLVTPSGVDYYTMGAEDICVMRLSDRVQVEGEMGASVEAGLHANVLATRPDCDASIHTHQPIASAYTLLAIPLDVQDDEHASMIGRKVPCVSYAPSGTGWLAKRVGQAFDETTHACLMRNHGAVCVGKNEHRAIQRVAVLEAACAAFFQRRLDETSDVPATTRSLIAQTLLSNAQINEQESTL